MTGQLQPYDPGQLPTREAPSPGECITIELDGLPPYKDTSRSIRNTTHPRYAAFTSLRAAASAAMAGRACYRGPVRLCVVLRAKKLHPRRTLLDYIAGVMDTLGGSHGPTFTYLPIVYEDDCQVSISDSRVISADRPSYRIDICFLDPTKPKPPSRFGGR